MPIKHLGSIGLIEVQMDILKNQIVFEELN